MINAVSSFFPASISSFLPAARAQQQSSVFKPADVTAAPPAGARASFADKLPSLFSLSPSDFASLFSVGEGASSFTGLFPGTVNAAYTQSLLLTSNRLSIQV